MRLHDRKEQVHDGEHAVEVAGAVGALQLAGHVAGDDPGVEAGGIDLVSVGHKDPVDTTATTQVEVGLQHPRVAREVVRVVELGRVHEDRSDDDIGTVPGLLKQGRMAAVQGPHRWHKANRRPLGPCRQHTGLHL